jgi:hypothetical protein
MASSSSSSSSSPPHNLLYDQIQSIIGTDAGDRGMRDLIVPGDLQAAAEILVVPQHNTTTTTTTTIIINDPRPTRKNAIILSGFPCCVSEVPPTETDGPPGTFAIARALIVCGRYDKVTVVTDHCNEAVFTAALDGLAIPESDDDDDVRYLRDKITVMTFPSSSLMTTEDEDRLLHLMDECTVVIACERAGPAKDGHCYTMRGIDMTEKGLIAPLHRLVTETRRTSKSGTNNPNRYDIPFIAIGDGGNELGMGKVLPKIIGSPKIRNGAKTGCAVPADYLIAASVSNWGGYALAASMVVAYVLSNNSETLSVVDVQKLVNRCLPSHDDEVALLDRCVAAGCRDGVSGKLEATVDGMPLETSLKCLQDIKEIVLSLAQS